MRDDRNSPAAGVQRTEVRLRATLDHLIEGCQIIDRDWRYLYVNPAAARHGGRSVDDLVGRTMTEAYPGIETTAMFGTLRRCMEARVTAELENEFAAPDGVKWFQLVVQPVPEGLFILSLDITSRKRAEDDLRESERRFVRIQRLESIGTLASGIAHDLNNVLMPITMGVTLLRRLSTDPRSLATVANIERAARRGSDLVNQILSFARGADEPRKPVDVRGLVAEVESMLRSTLPKNIALSAAIDPDVGEIEGDATQLHQVLLNLCLNARDAMPQGGRMTITANTTRVPAPRETDPSEFVRLEVRDTGTGVPKEILERIFEPFFTTKPAGKGTGLGLPTSQSIVRSHGGWIHVESEPEKGSAFQIFLPRMTASAATAGEEADAGEIPPGHGEWILFVDDEASILSVARHTLETFGYRVITAENGAQALALYTQHRSEIALVVTDIMMPDMDGGRLIAALRQMDAELPIIATSGESELGWTERARAAGARDVLTKPYSATSMLRAMADLLSVRRPVVPDARRPRGGGTP